MNDAEVLFPWEKDSGGEAQDYAHEPGASEAGAGGAAAADAAQTDTSDASTASEGEAQVPETGAAASDVDGPAMRGDAEGASAQQPAAAHTGAEGAPAGAGPGDPATADAGADDARFDVLDTEYARRAAERASAALRENPIAQKEYYSISEVCELVGLKPHVLRYWETQFQVLNPSKNRSGNRVYQRKEIRLITLVKHLLYEEKYTVEGARAKLDRLRRDGELVEVAGPVLDRSMIAQLRADLSELTTLLTPPART